MRLHEVLDMVGQAYDEEWIGEGTALDLLAEHGHVSRARAAALLILDSGGTGATPAAEWDGWGWAL